MRLTSLRWPFLISATSSVGTTTSWMKYSMFSEVIRFSRLAFTLFSMPE